MRISDWSSDVCSSDLGERNLVANAANLSALLWHALPDLNWCGFYLYDGAELVVGPFQGLPACIRIPLDKGVCGAAASSRQTQLVADVDAFPGHIACDRSEEHTSELQSLMRISYAVFRLKK